MKIACCAASLVPSDSANSIQVMKTCHALAQVGGTVCLWVPGQGTVLWPELSRHYGLTIPFELQWVSTRSFWRRYDLTWKVLRQAESWQADVVYTWLPQVALLALWRGIPAILELHGPPTGNLGPFIFRQFLRHPGRKRLLLITHALRTILGRDYLIPAENSDAVQIAPNGVDLHKYTNLPGTVEARLRLGLIEKVTVGYTGHLYEGRGIDMLLHLAEEFPQVNFLWIGGKPADVERWRSKLRQANLENVLLTGFIANQDLPLYQSACDVLLMPYENRISGSSGGNSVDYCSPMKMFDYLAVGRAIITSDLPVFHEVLNDGNAVFSPVGDLSEWRKSLSNLLLDRALMERLSHQAKLDAEKYTWEHRASCALSGFS